MPIYKYKVLTKEGLKKEGAILADSYECVYKILRTKNHCPMKIRKVYFASQKVSLDDLLTFFLHINFQLKCGVGINDAIESFTDFQGNGTLNATLLNISDSVKKGESIGEAFEKNHIIFDKVTVGLLKSVESTGNTLEIISNILNFLRMQMDWKNNVKRAIAYPIFIVIVAFIVLILGINFLGPQVISLLQSQGEIPPLTQFALEILPEISKMLLLSMVILSILPWTQRGRDFLLRLMLKSSTIGGLIVKISLWQFCKVLHIALDARLDFLEALDLAIKTIKIRPLQSELKSIRSDIVDGYRVSSSFANGRLIPKEILMAIYVGEEGNSLAESLFHISENQYKEILFGIKSLGQVLSIGLTIFTGLIFIFTLCSLFYPIYNYIEIAGL
ncbi:MAG: type II secretion system F family protein [Holosporaceae bacterium]|jgi:type II secretory pathway component PulF|nr:type II secretion system F family protein [Holosporaceae bacterium]